MNQSPDIHLEDIFEHAAALSAAERAQYLDVACEGQPEWRAEVESLLLALVAGGKARESAVWTPECAAELARGKAEETGGRIGAYRLVEQIGEGGFGTVWLAEQEKPVRRRVALKIIKLGMDTKEVIARFEQERQALAIMEHPGIAKVFDAGATQTGRPFFVMEWVRGKRITEYCDEAQLPMAERLLLFIEVCQAVQHAHQKGIIHRDLKPSNILVAVEGGAPVPKVIDFGVAKATGGQRLTDLSLHTRAEAMIGTPLYMSPEQVGLDGRDVDTRSDIYSLGLILYELLTGRTPFDAVELMQTGDEGMRRTIRLREPERPSTVLRSLPADTATELAQRRRCEPARLVQAVRGDLDWIVMKAIEKDRERRYETANGLAMDIRRHLNNEAVLARPASTLYRLRKIVRRNRLAFASAGVVALALIAGIAVSLSQAHRAGIAERQTRVDRDDAIEANTKYREQLRAMSRADHVVARGFLLSGRWREGVAYLGRAIQNDPANAAAKEHLWNALLNGTGDRDRLPRQVLKHNGAVVDASFSADGTRIVTASADKTARIWDAASGLPIGAPMRHEASVLSASFSDDGMRVVTASNDGTARLWDGANGRPVGEPMRHDGQVRGACFSLDGTRVLTASEDHTARLWNAANGQPIGAPLWHGDIVNLASFSADGTRLVTASDDLLAQIWDAESGQRIGVPLLHQSRVRGANFSPDGARLVTASEEAIARIWDVASGRQVGESLRHEQGIYAPSFSPDGTRVVTASWDQTARLWDAANGQPIGAPMRHDGPVYHASFSADGTRVVTASKDNTARVWDAATGLPITAPLRHEGHVMRASFSADGTRVVTASNDGTARLWDAANGQPPGEIFRHEAQIRSAEFGAGDTRIITASDDKTGRIWDAASGLPVGEPLRHEALLLSASFNADGTRAVTTGEDRTARLWDTASGLPVGEPMRHEALVSHASFSPDGARIATASLDRTARLWSAADAGPIGEPLRHGAEVKSASFSADGAHIVTAGNDDTVQIWNAATGLPAAPPMPTGATMRAIFNRDGTRVLTAGWRGSAVLWDAASGELRGQPMKHGSVIERATFNAAETRVLTASRDKTAQVWDAASGQPVCAPLRHDAEVGTASFSPDGTRVLTASFDKTARLWDAATGEPLGELRHEDRVWSASFSADGARVLTASADGTARIWTAPPAPSGDARWLEKLTAAASGLHFTQAGALEPLTELNRLALRDTLAAESIAAPTWQLAIQWLFAPPERQTARMAGRQSFRDVADREIASRQPAAIRKILSYDPGHPLLPIALAAFEKDETRAAFLRQHGLARLPADVVLLARAADLLIAQKQESLAAFVGKRAARRDFSEIPAQP